MTWTMENYFGLWRGVDYGSYLFGKKIDGKYIERTKETCIWFSLI